MVPKWSWTTSWWIFPDGPEKVEKWSESGPRGTAYITQWSKNVRKMVPGRPQTIFETFFDHFRTIFLQIEGAASGRRLPQRGGVPAFGRRPPPFAGSMSRSDVRDSGAGAKLIFDGRALAVLCVLRLHSCMHIRPA